MKHAWMFAVAWFAVVSTGLFAAPGVSEATYVRMPPMSVKPVVDGTISREEQHGTSAWYGPISGETGLMTIRYGMFYIGYDAKGFYFATRTQTPKLPQPISDDDSVTLTLLPPGASAPVSYTVRVKDAANDCPGAVSKLHAYRGVTDFGLQTTETESFIPYAALGVAMPKDGEKWGLQMKVRFAAQDEVGYWHWNKANPDEFGTLVADYGSMTPSFHSFGHMESYRATAWYKLLLRFANGTGRDMKLSSKCVAHMGVGPAKLDSDPSQDVTITHKKTAEIDGETVKAGASREFRHEDVPLWPGTINVFCADVSAAGKTLLRRRIAWDLSKGLKFADPVFRPYIRSAFYPSSGNLLRALYHRGGIGNLTKAEFLVRGDDGRIYWRKDISCAAGSNRIPDTDVFLERLGDLPSQNYKVLFNATAADGKTYSAENTFSVAKFPWQGLAIGKDRVVIPPFTPISVDGPKTSFLMTGYRCAGVLWDEIYAGGENILAAPVELKMNGEPFRHVSSRIVSAEEDRVVREIKAECGTVRLVVLQEYDYDGFCMVTLGFDPSSPVAVKSLSISVPLKNSLAKYFEVPFRDDKRDGQSPDFTLAEGRGEVWNSSMHVRPGTLDIYKAYVQPYIWYGDSKHGISTLLTTPRGLSHNAKDVMQRIEREGGAATLIHDFVTKEIVWESPMTIKIAFQPSPVKPKVWADQRFAQHMYGYTCPSNALGFSTSFTGFWANDPIRSTYNILPGNDRSLIDWCLSHREKPMKCDFYSEVDRYIARNAEWFETNRWNVTAKAFRDKQTNNWRLTGINRLNCYYDPVLVSCFWPEWEMYKAEWSVDEWPDDDLYNEYLGNMPSSYIDRLLYHMRNTVSLGADGFFFDCYSIMCCRNVPASGGRAYFKDKFTIQRHFGNIVHWRELVKRTATMCYRLGVLQNGRPAVTVHATDGIILPVCSFASGAMVTERGGHGGELPDAYFESYVLSDVTGLQCGVMTTPIMKTLEPETGGKKESQLKSLMAFMCAYGIFHLTDQGTLYRPWFEKAWNIVFDYGWGRPEVTGHWYYDKNPQPVSHTGRNVRLTVAEKKGRSALLMFGNLGDGEVIAFDVAGLGLGDVRISDAETGDEIGNPEISVDRHGYRMVLVEKR